MIVEGYGATESSVPLDNQPAYAKPFGKGELPAD